MAPDHVGDGTLAFIFSHNSKRQAGGPWAATAKQRGAQQTSTAGVVGYSAGSGAPCSFLDRFVATPDESRVIYFATL